MIPYLLRRRWRVDDLSRACQGVDIGCSYGVSGALGDGLLTDMRAVKKDYCLDHDHSAYVDQWDWELRMAEDQHSLAFLTKIVEGLGRTRGRGGARLEAVPGAQDRQVHEPTGDTDVHPC